MTITTAQTVYPWDDLAGRIDDSKAVLTSASGIYAHDAAGNRLIDGPGGMWCVNIGHGRDEMAEAMAAQARTLGYVSPWSFTVDPSLALTERLAAYSPADLNHVFYTTCGSTAVDTALRFAFFYNNSLGRPEKKLVLSRDGAYHGSTFLGATCSGKASDKTLMDMADGRVHHLTMPNPLRRPDDMTERDFCDHLVDELERAIVDHGADRVAAFIAEPVLASGGVVVPPEGYHRRTLEVCRRHDVLYISDEVVTAFGRLGAVFASKDVFDIEPDIITTAKGLTSGYVPMGAVFISDRLIGDIAAANQDPTYFTNGFTYSAHPVAVAAATTNLDIIEREGLIDHANAVGPHLQQRLGELADLDAVVEVRGLGLMAAVELSLDAANPDEERDSDFANVVDRLSQQRGLIVRPIYNNCVMSPPLIITRDQIDDIVSILRSAIIDASAG